MIRLAIVLALAAVVVAVGVFFVPFAFTEQWSWRASIGSTLTTAIALILGAIALLVTARVESSDYKAQQQTKTDIAGLLATLAMVVNKGALARTGQIQQVDFRREAEAIEGFVHSTTGFAMYMMAAQKSRAARRKSEEWRLFFMYVAELISKPDEPGLVLNRAIRLLELLLKLDSNDLRAIGRSVSNLVSGISAFDRALDDNVVIKAMRNVAAEEGGGGNDKERNALVISKLQFLKTQGVDDPNVDLFLAVHAGDTVKLKNALDRGADPNITDTAVLEKHKAILANFKE